MEEAWETLHPPKLHFDWQPSLLNSFSILPNLSQPNTTASNMNHRGNMVTANEFPVNSALKVPQSHVGLVNEPRNWFHSLAPSQQALFPAKSPNDELSALSKGLSKEGVSPLADAGSGLKQKGFLVIDQSADKTTLVLCSGGGASFQLLSSWSPQPTTAYKLDEDIRTKMDFVNDSKLVMSNDFAENQKTDEQSEMQEDTEELNALLYSDDESEFDEDDEVTSTGHSPSTMTTKEHLFEGSYEEVASSVGSTKKRKIDRGQDGTSLMDTACSLVPQRIPEFEDDAESSCGNDENLDMQDVGSFSINKKMRKEKIRETVSILQSIIPGGEGKEAIVVLDEAIRYLNSLKLKAEAFGLKAC